MTPTATSTTENGPRGEFHVVPFIIDGKQFHHKDQIFDVVSPATGKVLHQCASPSVDDWNRAVDSCQAVFQTWRNSTLTQRRDIFLKAADIMAGKMSELAGYMVTETGAATGWAEINVHMAVDFIKDIAGRISGIEGSYATLKDPSSSAIIMQEPYGVVLGMAPWNAPYILGTRAVAYPVAAGNTVILKGSERCPRTMWAIIDCFHEAGLPAGVMNYLCCEREKSAEMVTDLVEHRHVKKINFTGSTAVGRRIAKLAGENLKPVVLELGGKAPAIIWEDADLDNAAAACVWGAFYNSGQVCMSTERIFVHKNIKEEFNKKFAAEIERVYSSSEDAPVLIGSEAVKGARGLVEEAISQQANVIVGDHKAEEKTDTRLRPIVVDEVTQSMDIYKHESFAPIVGIVEIETEEQAINFANDTEYGLTAAVFTEDLRRGLRLARSIETGAVHINSATIHDEPNLPHGGAKASGYGRFNAAQGLNEWVRTKCVTFKN